MSDLLKALGPMGDIVVTIDFETFFGGEYMLRKMTTESYVRDPRFQVLGVGLHWGGLSPVWLEEWEFREWASRADWSRIALNAHHAQFDGFVLSHHFGIKPRFWYCTMSMARGLHGVSRVGLEFLGPKYGLGEKGTDLEIAKGKRREQLTQVEWLRVGAYCKQDVRLTSGLRDRMAPQLPPEELWLVDTTIRMSTEPNLVANEAVLVAALNDERARKGVLLDRIEELAGEDAKSVLSSSEKFANVLRALGYEPPTKTNAKGKTIFAFAKTDPGMKNMLESENDDIRFLAEARLSVKSTIVETRVERMLGVASRGRVPAYLKYCGAHTHRWSGGDRLNLQNLNRGGKLRAALESPEGELLVVADSGQIEARVLPWLAGDAALLGVFRDNDSETARYQEAFAEHVRDLGREPTKEEAKRINAGLGKRGLKEGDFYSTMGTKFFFLRPISKEETPVERQTSKAMSLGLGFGMGAFKFAAEQLKGMLGAPPMQFTRADAARFKVDVAAWLQAGWGDQTNAERVAEMHAHGFRLSRDDLEVHCAVAAHFVNVYRKASPKIVALWKAFDAALPVMADPKEDGGQVRSRVGCLKVVRHGLLKPNGMTLHYPGLRRSGRGFVYQGGASGRETCHIYGGLATENAVQSLARDIVAEQALWVRVDLGPEFRLVTTTHDEIAARVPQGEAAAAYARAVQRMKVAPAWCSDLPLNASGGFAKSYGAVK